MLITAMMVAHLNFIFVPVKLIENIQMVPLPPYEICNNYRRWQQAWNTRVKDILDDNVDHLTWHEFVAIKEGNKIPEMEEWCKKAGE